MLKFITKEQITKSVCNSNSTLSTGYRCDVRLRYDLSSICLLRCRAQPAEEWRKTRALKMLDVKMMDVKLTDQCAGHEIAGHEIAGHKIAG